MLNLYNAMQADKINLFEHQVTTVCVGIVIVAIILTCVSCTKGQTDKELDPEELESLIIAHKNNEGTARQHNRSVRSKERIAFKEDHETNFIDTDVVLDSQETLKERKEQSLIAKDKHLDVNFEADASTEDAFLASAQQLSHKIDVEEIQPKNTDVSRLAKFRRTISNISSHIIEEMQPNSSELRQLANAVRDKDNAAAFTEDVGTLYFTISYDLYERIFTVVVQKAVGLAAKDRNGLSDPFCKVYLVPGKKQKIETKVIRKNLNPVWEETLTFEGFPQHVLKQRVLRLKVYDFDSFSKNDPIGNVEVVLANAVLQDEPVKYVRRLRPHSQSSSSRGEILLSLSYDQTLGRISVTVEKCRHLKKMNVTGKCDPYVKIYSYYSGRCVDKKKTRVRKQNLNPEWKETIEFELPLHRARDVMFVFRVMDFDQIMVNRPLGDACVGYRTGSAQNHWTDMLYQPKNTVSMWHTLEKPKKYRKLSFS